MKMPHDPADQGFDRALSRALAAGEPPVLDCPGPDLLAAWLERSLARDESERWERHFAGCARCQTRLAALSRTFPEDRPSASLARWLDRLRGSGWTGPVAVAATAVLALTIAIRESPTPDRLSAPMPPVERAPPSRAKLEAPPAPRPDLAAKPEGKAQAPSRPAAPAKGETGADAETGRAAPAAKSVAEAPPAAGEPSIDRSVAAAPRLADEARRAPAEAPMARGSTSADAASRAMAPAAESLHAQAERDRPGAAARLAGEPRPLAAAAGIVAAPDGGVVWRFGERGRIERSTDRGRSWERQSSGVDADLFAGSAPSPTVCWIVGARGTVLLATDGAVWRRAEPPAADDLIEVSARDAAIATVRARGGRAYETRDGGRTWEVRGD
jgi:hypothetical protein